MTAAIADTDILSTFGKVGRIDLLLDLFQHLYVAPAVSQELRRAERMGFSWVARIRQMVEGLPLTDSERKDVERLFDLYPQLGSGEIESFVLAQTHNLLCLTNDRQAKTVARILNLSYLDLEELLRALKNKGMLTTGDLAVLIAHIEEADRTQIKAKEQILSR
jgi:predicted nucleic acid-binding protein